MTRTLTPTPSAAEYDPFDPAILLDPYPAYVRLRDEAPAFFIRGAGMWALSRYDDVRAASADARRFSSAAMASLVQGPRAYSAEPTDDDATSVIGADGEEHTRLRSIVNRGFTPRRMRDLEPHVRARAQSLIAEIASDGEADLITQYASPLPPSIIAEMLGVDPDRQDDLRRWSDAMMLAVFEQPDEDQQAEIATCLAQLGEWLSDVIEQREEAPGPDLVSTLLRAETEEGRLSRHELENFVVTLLVAGSVTSTHLFGNAVLALLRHPAILDRLRAEPVHIPAVVEEVMRFDSPVQTLPRVTTEDVDVAGSTIPSGSIVLLLFGSANRDERVFERAGEFDPWRQRHEHVALGHGPHFCLGAALARLEVRIALEELLAGAPRLRPAGPIERTSSFVFRGCSHLPVRLV